MANPRIPFRLSSARPSLPPLHGKRILVHLVVNVEHWQFDQPMPRSIITPSYGGARAPDVPNYSWADYGMRAGLPRILKLFKERRLPASASINAGVIEAYPAAAEAVLEAGWEFIGHGMHEQAMDHEEGEEEEWIQSSIERIASFTGRHPRGWLSPGLSETADTPDLLKASGIDYVCDWVVDDLPSWMATRHGAMIAMPYNIEINDTIIYAIERHDTGQMAQRLAHTLRLFEEEAEDNIRVLAIGLHPHLIAVPHRFHELVQMIEMLQASSEVAFVTGTEICDWYMAAEPLRV